MRALVIIAMCAHLGVGLPASAQADVSAPQSSQEKRYVVHAVFPSPQLARELAALISNGDNFVEAAARMGLAKGDIEIGVVDEAELTKILGKVIGETVYASPPQRLFGPFQSDLGWHLIQSYPVKNVSVAALATQGGGAIEGEANPPPYPSKGTFYLSRLKHGEAVEFGGDIGEGVAEALEAFLKQAPHVRTVRLRSDGGRVSEATRIKDLIRRRGLDTYTDYCASSCTVAFLGGRHRYIGEKATIGFHEAERPKGLIFGFPEHLSKHLADELKSEGVSRSFAAEAAQHKGADIWYPAASVMIAAGFATSVLPAGSSWVREAPVYHRYQPIYYALEALEAEDYGKAVSLLTPIGQRGSAVAQLLLGHAYQGGFGVQQDLRQAFEWFKLSAEQGEPSAQNNLGIAYAKGAGTKPDPLLGVLWIERSANNGDPQGQFNLANRYFRGEIKRQNYAQAMVYYMLAAAGGEAAAAEILGYMFAKGLGTETDNVKALMWWSIAADSRTSAQTLVRSVSRSMSLKDTATAQSLAQEWRARPKGRNIPY